MRNKIPLKIGDKFNRLTLKGYSHTGNHFRKYYKYQCDCGNEKVLLGSLVTSGNTKSCGCLAMDLWANKEKLPERLGVKRQIILQYKRHAKTRGIDYNISEQDFINLLTLPCFYCGQIPNNIKRTKNDKDGFVYSGVDRFNSTIGYNINNCVPCCKVCNFAKSNMSIDEFHKWALRIGQKAMATQWGEYLASK